MQVVPIRWLEPIEEGLWRPSLLFGIPFWTNLYHPTFWFVGFLAHSFWFSVQLSFCVHALLMAATAVEPEWIQILNDVLVEPVEIDP